jgi:quercetin dioxygenase-like cupin family protein
MKYGLLIIGLLMIYSMASAHEDHKHVVPETEYAIARDQKAEGPQVSKGIESIAALGSVSLEGELLGVTDRILRARELVIAPGGVVAVHQHDGRPGMAYILEGEIIEHRSDMEEPVTRNAGTVSFEKTGLIHWWENRSDKPVRALVVDIVSGQ